VIAALGELGCGGVEQGRPPIGLTLRWSSPQARFPRRITNRAFSTNWLAGEAFVWTRAPVLLAWLVRTQCRWLNGRLGVLEKEDDVTGRTRRRNDCAGTPSRAGAERTHRGRLSQAHAAW
jgi:hypothetical protein